MQNLFYTLIFLVSLSAQGQDYFSREYNTAILVLEDKEIKVPTKVEFNVFRTTDILIRMGEEEPTRYIQIGDAVDPRGEGLDIDFQYVNVKLAGTDHLYEFALYNDGDFLIVNKQTYKKILFTNK